MLNTKNRWKPHMLQPPSENELKFVLSILIKQINLAKLTLSASDILCQLSLISRSQLISS